MPELSIIIPTWKRNNIFSATISAVISAVSNIDAEVIVINDNIEDKILVDHPKVKVYNNTGRGVTRARNLGASLATAPLLLFIDNDILISSENLIKTLKVHKTKSRVIVNANWVYPPAIISIIDKYQFGRIRKFWKLDSFESRYIFHNKGLWEHKLFKATLPFAGFYFSISKDIFLNFLKFNENIVFGKEEEELSKKISDNDITYWVDPENIVYHNEIDRIADYREWLKNVQMRDCETIKKSRPFRLRSLALLAKINYFILDHFPNKTYLDKTYAKFLYMQTRLLKK